MFPIEREPGPHVRVAPNTSMFASGAWDEHFGELVQSIYSAAADEGMSVEFDADQHPRRGEQRVGAAQLEALRIVIESAAAFEGAWRLGEIIFERVVPWIVKHRGASGEDVSVQILGPDGEVIKSVLVDPDGETRDHP
jgi:hypothetical protein